MNQNKSLYKLFFIIFVGFILVFSFISLKHNLVKSSGILVNKNELKMIKNFFTQKGIFDGSNLEVTQIQGDKDILNLKFNHPSLSGHYYTYYALYNTRSNKLFTTLEEDDISINMMNTQYIGQISDDVFLIIDNSGVLYSITFKTPNDYKIRKLSELNIAKNDIQDIMALEDNLYILTREFVNDFNEKTLSSGAAYKISFDRKYKKATVSKTDLEEDTIPVKFILNSEKNVGYTSIDTIDVPIEYGNTYSTSADKDYLTKTASRNNNYRLFNLSKYNINFFDNSVKNIDDSYYSVEQTSFVLKANKDLNIQTGAIFGVPVYIDSKNDRLIAIEEYLHNSISYRNPSKDCLLYSITDNKVDYGTYNTNFISFSPSIDKNYVGYIYTDIGTIGILPDGSYKRITVKGVACTNKKIIIFENNDAICFAKTV